MCNVEKKKYCATRTFIQHITKSNSSRVYFARRAITLVNALRCEPRPRPRTTVKRNLLPRLYAETPHHVALIVTIFQVLQTNWIRAGRDTRIRITTRIARSIWLLHIIPGIGIARADKLQKTRTKERREMKSAWARERGGGGRQTRTLESAYGDWNENSRASPAQRVSESNYGSSGSIAAKNQGRKSPAERAEETNLSGLSSAESRVNPVAGDIYGI